MNELQEKLLEIIKVEFKGVSGDHGVDHTMNVYNNAIHLAETEGANIEVVKAAALLHDIGRKEEAESKVKLNHAEIGAEKTEKILSDLGCDPEFIERVRLCVLRHRTRDNKAPESIEEKVIFDADKLDSIGAVGIGRAFMWAGKVGAKIHNPVADLSDAAEYGPEDTAFREFEIKLKHVNDKMMTAEEKRLAERRHKFMTEFFDEINHEVLGEN